MDAQEASNKDIELMLKAGAIAVARSDCSDEFPSCLGTCGKQLDCGVHKCRRRCHDVQTICSADPEGNTPASDGSEDTLSKDNMDRCRALVQSKCRCGHRNVSLPCQEFSNAVQELLSAESLTESERRALLRLPNLQQPHPAATCTRKCGMHLSCRTHRCKELCCNLTRDEHRCLEVCGKPLACGEHTCDRFCHSGPCGKCEVMLEEGQTCDCGRTHTPGPLLCGDDRVPCPNPCTKRPGRPAVSADDTDRERRTTTAALAEEDGQESSGKEEKEEEAEDCEHPCPDFCHTGPCRPCNVQVFRMCSGGHRKRVLVSCQQRTQISCGEPCSRILPCGGHRCQRRCHTGSCKIPTLYPANTRRGTQLQHLGVSTAALVLSAAASKAMSSPTPTSGRPAAGLRASVEDPVCREPCLLPRQDCGHECGAPCHPDTPCPGDACTVKVESKCPCGRRAELMACAVARGVTPLSEEEESSGSGTRLQKMLQQRLQGRVECDERCAVQQRNERFARALGRMYGDAAVQSGRASDPDVERFIPYPQELLEEVINLRLLPFLERVEPIIQNFVRQGTSGASTATKQNHFFPPMPRNQRWLLHQLASFYGVTATSYDQEPNRNVGISLTSSSVAPRVSLLEAVQEHVRNPRSSRTVPQSCILQLFQIRLPPSRILSTVAQTGADPGDYRLSFLSERRAILVFISPELAQEARGYLKALARQGLLSFSEHSDEEVSDSEEEEETARRRWERKQRRSAPSEVVVRPQWVSVWDRDGKSEPPKKRSWRRQPDPTPSPDENNVSGHAPAKSSWGRRPGPGDETEEWPCKGCTFRNSIWSNKCRQCDHPRVETPAPATAAAEMVEDVEETEDDIRESSNPWELLRDD